MTLTISKPYAKPYFGKGIFVNPSKIYSVEDVSGTIPHPLTSTVDIGLRLTLDIGKDFMPELLIAGNFKRDAAGDVCGWGSAFPVQELLSKLGYDGVLNSDNTLPDEALESLIGKSFLRLSYVSGSRNNGKAHYSDWNIIATVEEGAESLVKRFQASLAKGFPRNYRPDILDTLPQVEHSVTQPVDDEDVF